MRFTLKASDLNSALDIVSNVTPSIATTKGAGAGTAGYLFKTYRDRDGNPKCHIYSREANEVARGDLKLSDLDGEGMFAAPLKFLDNLRCTPDDEVTFDVSTDGGANGAYSISYKTSSGASQDGPSFDPRLISPIDKDVEAADPSKTRKFPASILRDAISMSKKFLDPKSKEEYLKTVQIFDASNEAWSKGNGNMFATNGTKAFYFYSEVFENNGFTIHLAHLDRFVSFLGKCQGDIEVRYGDKMMFAVNVIHGKDNKIEGELVFGWAYHEKGHTKYGPMPSKFDKYVLRVRKPQLINAINYIQMALEGNREKASISFSAADKTLVFSTTDSAKKANSFPVIVDATCVDDVDFKYSLNIYQFLELVEDVKGNDVFLHVAPLAVSERRLKPSAAYRTLDDFWVDPAGKVICGVSPERDENGNEKRPTKDAIKCRVTRFMPGMD